jgi:hypothetical protein
MADRYRRALTSLALLVVLGGAASGAAAPDVAVRARFTFDKKGAEYSNLRVVITRGAATWRSGPLGKTFFIAPKVTVRDLDADGEPEVVFDTYTGGAHCCLESRIFRYLPASGSYGRTFHSWADVGYRLLKADGDGRPEFVSADARFAYEFTAFAASFFPIQIWHFERGRVVDTTRLFPARIEADAAQLRKEYLRIRRQGQDVRGVLAAWQADLHLLGRAEEGWAEIERARKAGALGPRQDLSGWPQGTAYVKALRAYLVKLGYA